MKNMDNFFFLMEMRILMNDDQDFEEQHTYTDFIHKPLQKKCALQAYPPQTKN